MGSVLVHLQPLASDVNINNGTTDLTTVLICLCLKTLLQLETDDYHRDSPALK